MEHEIDVIRHADWIVDVGPAAGEHGGRILYSGPSEGLATGRRIAHATISVSIEHAPPVRSPRKPNGWLKLSGVTRNNLIIWTSSSRWAFLPQ